MISANTLIKNKSITSTTRRVEEVIKIIKINKTKHKRKEFLSRVLVTTDANCVNASSAVC